MSSHSRLLLIGVGLVIVFIIGGLVFMFTRQTRPEPASLVPQETSSTTVVEEQKASVAPTLTKVTGPTQLKGADLWIFVQDDGQPSLAVSAESGGKVVMGRLNLQDPTTAITWKTVASSTDTGGERSADHWHIYAHDAHWIVFSLTSAKTSYLLKLSKDFERQALVKVADSSIKGPGGGDMPTNDMFMVAEDNGVAVGHFLPGYGSRIFRFDKNAKQIGTVDVGGGQYSHANLSSAEKTETGYLIYASETGAPDVESSIRQIETDKNWRPVKSDVLVQESGKNSVMPSVARLANGYRIMHARVRSGVKQAADIPSAPGGELPPDDGAIVRYIISPSGKVVSQQTVVESGANRPHTTIIGDQLITSWDQRGIYIQVDNISTN